MPLTDIVYIMLAFIVNSVNIPEQMQGKVRLDGQNGRKALGCFYEKCELYALYIT